MSSAYRWDSGSLKKGRHFPTVTEVSYDNKESLLRPKPLTGYQEEAKASLAGDLIGLPSPESY